MREVLLEDFVTDRGSTFQVLLIDSPMPDVWIHDRPSDESSAARNPTAGAPPAAVSMPLGPAEVGKIVDGWV